MNKIKQALIFLILPLLIFACSPTKVAKKPPPFRIVRTTLAKDVDDRGTRGIPLNPTTTFTTEDPEVVSSVEYENLLGKHKLRWEWYDPRGNLYTKTGNYPIKSSKNNLISIDGKECMIMDSIPDDDNIIYGRDLGIYALSSSFTRFIDSFFTTNFKKAREIKF